MDNQNLNNVRERVVREVVKRRCSTRSFSDRPISANDLMELVEAGIYAPSASNWQNQRFLLITDKEEIEQIGRMRFVWPWPGNHTSVRKREPAGLLGRGAALIIVFVDALKNDRRMNGEYHIWQHVESQNAAASIENILILATAKGIGSCWVSASEPMSYSRMLSRSAWWRVLKRYEIPRSFKIQGIVVLGYPRRSDDEGFPMGEKMHGATVWQDTSRKPVDTYMIKGVSDSFSRRNMFPKDIIAKILSALIRAQFLCLKFTDMCLWMIEIGKKDSHRSNKG